MGPMDKQAHILSAVGKAASIVVPAAFFVVARIHAVLRQPLLSFILENILR